MPLSRFNLLSLLIIFISLLVLSGCQTSESRATIDFPDTVRVCVIGGMTMTGLWDEIARRFETATGYHVELAATGPRPKIAPPFRQGKADFLVMHSGDITTDLVADGYGINMRPCARNDLVIVGPPDDPAGIRGLTDGAEALRRIAATESTFLDVNSNGARELGHTLWRQAGIRPHGDWFIQDDAQRSEEILGFAARRHAYAIFGRMPITQHKVTSAGLAILVENDPTMRRPYVLMEANPARLPGVNQPGAHALAEFILSEPIQRAMADFGRDRNGGYPFFYPVWPYAEEDWDDLKSTTSYINFLKCPWYQTARL